MRPVHTTMKPPNQAEGTSDAVQYTCTCPPATAGSVLLFYRYFSAPPALPSSLFPQTQDLTSFASWYTFQTESLQLSGKVRLATEGFNVTVAGSTSAIADFIEACVSHWSFAGLDLATLDAQRHFFKPTPGCACVFGNRETARVRIVREATPMGVEGYEPKDWRLVISLKPEEFHERLLRGEDIEGRGGGSLLLDVRNHYESRIGYFVTGNGEKAMRPQIRRFSQWPQFVKAHLVELRGDRDIEKVGGGSEEGKSFMTYCTGGIRCEKGVRFMQERLRPGDKVYTLEGGIAAYLKWMDGEIEMGRKTAADSLFKGRNYVFDARGSMGLADEELVSHCHMCEKVSSRLGKCHSNGCHLVLVVCDECEENGYPRCCQECSDMDAWVPSRDTEKRMTRPICACERARENQLWARESKTAKTQGWKTRQRQRQRDKINIPVQVIGKETGIS